MITRRALFKASAASTLAPLSVGATQSSADESPRLEKSNQSFSVLMSQATNLLLESYPESASSAGVDTGKLSHLKSRLTDRSIAGQDKIKNNVQSMLRKLDAVDNTQLSSKDSLDLNAVRTVFQMTVDGFDIPYGEVALLNSNWSYRNSPYAVAQNTGAFVEIPSFLDSSHSIKTESDASAYLERIKAYADQLDGESERVSADGSRDVILPDFLMAKTLNQLKASLNSSAKDWGLVTTLTDKSSQLNLDPSLSAAALELANMRVKPAMARQIAALEALAPKAKPHAGVWALPDGDDYYKWALQAGTTTTMSPDEVHQMGIDELARLHGRMDPILKSIGYSKGSVGDRMTALAKDKRYHFSDGDKGRQEILAFIDSTLLDIRKRMPDAFETLVPGFLEVTRISPEVEAGAPGAYGGPGSVDGKKPGHYWINLRTPALHNKFSLADLTYHEAIPGHVWQGEYTFKQSLLRSLLAFNAYSEGWALYAEQIADELGVYGKFPVGQLGYLQSLAFRACRLVVDTGLHAKRWTREEANQWFVTNNGSNPEEVRGEVDRYCAWPGQACGYKVGHTTIVNLRTKAQEALEDKFDFRKFNDAVVLSGSVPMTVLEDNINKFISDSH
ncbi:DUF885 family protein [Arenicella sp. 4NH20-0111]|uniref:DUF885 domain-containing protein n=1 Tax=Arenicella sp. 4NH20-0111 TaxID=3127648 RepID=UPI003340461F